MVEKGVRWNLGKVFFGERKVYDFNLLPEEGHRVPGLHEPPAIPFRTHPRGPRARDAGRGRADRAAGRQRGSTPSRRRAITWPSTLDTPEGPYEVEADWLVACDGAGSPIRSMMGLDFVGRVFEDNFLIADVVKMDAEFPTERWFWFDPPFNPGQSALLHKQPDGVWRIDLQTGLGHRQGGREEARERHPAAEGHARDDVSFELEWVSIYTFQCRRMERFRHGRVIFAGDGPPGQPIRRAGRELGRSGRRQPRLEAEARDRGQGARRAARQLRRRAHPRRGREHPELEPLHRFHHAEIETSRLFRDAVLDLSEHYAFARPLVNSGRLSVPCTYDGSPLNTPDALPEGPARTRPGSPCPDAPVGNGFLLEHLGGFIAALHRRRRTRAAGRGRRRCPVYRAFGRRRSLGRARRALSRRRGLGRLSRPARTSTSPRAGPPSTRAAARAALRRATAREMRQ